MKQPLLLRTTNMYEEEEDWFLPDERSDREPVLACHPTPSLPYPQLTIGIK